MYFVLYRKTYHPTSGEWDPVLAGSGNVVGGDDLGSLFAGVIRYRGARIQLLDLPGIIEGAKDGKGRGRQVWTGPPHVIVQLPRRQLVYTCHLTAACPVPVRDIETD